MEVINKVGSFVISLINDSSVVVKKARSNHTKTNFNSNLVLVDNLGKAIKLGGSDTFNGIFESMSYSDYYKQTFTVDFYGSTAFDLCTNFIALLRSQRSYDLQSQLGLTFYHPDGITDLKQLNGTTYNNRLQIDFVVGYWISADIDTLRIDTVEIDINVEQ